MKILVTGAAGFIGFHVARKLIERGDTVVGIDNLNGYYDVNLKKDRLKELGIDCSSFRPEMLLQSNLHSTFSFMKLDISNRNGLESFFENESFDGVCHLAAQAGVRYSIENPNAYINSNVVGFVNMLEGCRHNNIKNFVFASSSSVYGLNKSQPFKATDHTDHPVSLYAATKKSNEMMAHAYAHLYDLQVTGLRFFTVYGPWGRPDMAPMLFVRAILGDKSIKVFNYGDMRRDFTYIDDIVNGVLNVIDNPAQVSESWSPHHPTPNESSANFKIYNIGNSSPIKLIDFIATIEKKLGKVSRKEMLPMQDGDVQSTYADISGLESDFNYKPLTSLDKGIENFVDWYQRYYKENKVDDIL